ncbi:zinc finger protein 350-like isoform X1 [Actinia tenebrosa]|uniref:Zinc finger protein 350-like isoform X1 n=1 Tax=Actinia tenebrosa TaxID=6105 RepID=A0A6P8I3N9_ACTTE|nr:zinc finger protein 350-like isoform X1 [Actinia tenebrosa]
MENQSLYDMDQEVVEEQVTEFQCPQCVRQFKHKRGLVRHQNSVHLNERHPCENCGRTFSEKYDLKRHEKVCPGGSSKRKSDDGNDSSAKKQKLTDAEIMEYELANIPPEMYEEYDGPILGDDDENDEQHGGGPVDQECALNNSATKFKYNPNKREKYDLLLTLGGKKKTIMKQLQKQLKKHRGIKWFLCVQVKMMKSSPDGKDQKFIVSVKRGYSGRN